jgi:hypothetical protein
MFMKKIVFLFFSLLFFQLLGYYLVGKRILVNRILNEYQLIAVLDSVPAIRVNINNQLMDYQKDKLGFLFKNKPIIYNYFKDINHTSSDVFFSEDTLSFTINIDRYIFPFANATYSETTKGWGAHEEYRYVWVLFYWFKIEHLGGGIA